MGWIILSTLSGLSSSLFNYVNRYVLKANGDSTSFAWWFEVLRVIIFLIILPFDNFIIWSHKTIFLLLLIGIIEVFSVYFFMKMHSFSELSISSIVLRLRIVWIPIFAFFLVGEKLSLKEYLGIFIILIGLSFVTSPKKFFVDKGVKLALLSTVITALLSTVIKMATPLASASVISIAMGLPAILVFPLLAKSWGSRIRSFYRKSIAGVSFAIFFNSISMYLQISALRIGPVGKVMAILQAMSIVSVLMGIFFLNEKKDVGKKIAGSLIVLFGVFILLQ